MRSLFKPDVTIIDILIKAGADPDAKDTVSGIQRAGRKKWSIQETLHVDLMEV